MKILFSVVILLLSLSGCSTYSVFKSCKEAGTCINYAQVSEGNASGFYAALTGAGITCKVSTFGDPTGWAVSYKGDKCTAKFGEPEALTAAQAQGQEHE